MLLLLFGVTNANANANTISNLKFGCVAKCYIQLGTLLIRGLTDNPKRILNVRTEIRRDKSENSINNENEKNKTENGEKIVDGSRAHVLELIECTEIDRIRRVFLWHTEDIQTLLFAHSM